MMKKNSILSALTLALALSLVFSFTACDTPSDGNNGGGGGDDLPAFTGVPLFEVSFNGEFNPDFTSDSITLIDSEAAVLSTSKGAMKHNTAGESTQIQEGGFFASKTAAKLQFAGGAWGGVHFELDPLVDVSTSSKAYIAVKGDLKETTFFGFKLIAGAEVEVNFLKYPKTDGKDGWTVYTVPFEDFEGTDLTTFKGFGLWNPNVDDSDARDKPENYPVLSDIVISVAFGN
ncbi:MAG TPA: hypothetical protein VJ855_04670 [Marinilabiliaceae bacterium]|nr:hypothetical protein [Marinilabiliaceae bacterium]